MELNWTFFFLGMVFTETATLAYKYPRSLLYFSVLVLAGLFSKTLRNSFFFFVSLKLVLEVFSFKQMWKLGKMMISIWGNMEETITS